MFGLFKKSGPPKTSLENVLWLPHVEEVFLWFLKNDTQFQQILIPSIATLFEEGYRPLIELNNDPKILHEQSEGKVNIQYPHSWLWARVSLDIINFKRAIESNVDPKDYLEKIIDALDDYGKTTIISAGEIIHKYNLDPLVKNLDNELSKIPTELEKEEFKQNFLADTLNADEIRLLSWFFRELFNEDYKLKS